jgi:hypothetical protein
MNFTKCLLNFQVEIESIMQHGSMVLSQESLSQELGKQLEQAKISYAVQRMKFNIYFLLLGEAEKELSLKRKKEEEEIRKSKVAKTLQSFYGESGSDNDDSDLFPDL